MYTKFYQLREEPFRLTPDPKFLHLAEPNRAALAMLLDGIMSRKGFLVLYGPIGTGKTTLMHAALHLLEDNLALKDKLSTAFVVNPTLSPSEFLEAVLDEFEVHCPSSSKPRRLAAFHEMLLATQRKGGTTVLIVDEAHLLTPELLEEIRLLSNTDTYQEKPLQVVLSGQPELQAHLHHPRMKALQQRVAANCHLRPLSLPETRVYVSERLHAAGLRGESPFGVTALEKLFEFTSGVPRLINLLCDNALSLGAAQLKQVIDAAIIEEAAAKLQLLPEQVEAAKSLSVASRTSSGAANVASLRSMNGRVSTGQDTQADEHVPALPEEEILTAVDMLINAMKQRRGTARE